MAVIVCPTCATRYRVADSQLSKASKLRCKKCNMVFQPQDSVEPDQVSQDRGMPEISTPTEESIQISQQTETTKSQEELLPDVNLSDVTLDFGSSPESPAAELDFSFTAKIPEEGETSEDEEISDHIGRDFQDDQEKIEIGLGESPLRETGVVDTESTVTMDQGLDFSFSARIPELEEAEKGEEEGEGVPEESAELTVISGQGPSKAVIPPGDQSVEPSVGEQIQEELLSTCCIDSLAMGLKRCDICGKNLEGKERVRGEELKQQRRQQLKDELLRGEVQVGFSEEQVDNEASIFPQVEEDFSDVEQALDALADGSFEKLLKRKEAKKTAAKKMKMIGVGAGLILLLMIGGIWMMLPSSHENLVSRYEHLISQEEMKPQEVTALFLDAAIEKDQEVFNRVSVMQTMPDITAGTVISVGKEDDEISLGILGKDIQKLQEEIATIGKKIEEKTRSLQAYSSKDLSPKLIEEAINMLTAKLEVLQAEFDQKEAESAKKLVRLQQELTVTKTEIEENESISQRYMDATDRIGKALYQNSQVKKALLADAQSKLEDQIRQEEIEHRKRVQDLEMEYAPRFSELNGKIQTQRALYEESKLLQDREKSPLKQLSEELEQMTKTIVEKKSMLEEKEQQLQTAIAFFKRDDQKQRITKDQNIAEFVHLSRNVVASVKFRGSSKQKVPIVLKRYRALIADQTIQGDWIVETILQ
jgi:predicted Zn finger-like uncharacterized protein